MINEASVRIQGLLEKSFPGLDIEVYRTIDGLSARLRRPKDDALVAVLLAESRKELLDFLSLLNLFRDIRIILIIPDRNQETIALAHQLRPNFLCYKNSDFTEFIAVLNKMLQAYKHS
jgi:hypothetical protein